MSTGSPGFGELDGTGLRIAVVTARFNEAITEGLARWAREGLLRHGVAERDVSEVSVPGAFELPVVAGRLARSGGVDAVVCVGAVIRGETPHFDYVAGEAARGLQQIALETGVPVVFGVLTTDTVGQAEARCRDDETNKGYEAARAAIDTARVLERLEQDRGAGPGAGPRED